MKRKPHKKRRLLPLLCLLAVWVVWSNLSVAVERYTVRSGRLPHALDGFTIAQVSDFHAGAWGQSADHIARLLEAADPDMIAFTGDLVDHRSPDVAKALALVRQAARIAPCYYVTGNHEAQLSHEDLTALMDGLAEAGVTVLRNQWLAEGTDSPLVIAGVDDTAMRRGAGGGVMRMELDALNAPKDRFTILLSHRPEHLALYAGEGFDLVLAGHAHGGQVRIPFAGGLYAPGQGLFPKYTDGLYTLEDTRMIVSRGLGGPVPRINDRPELVLIELQSDL